jgi:Protein of unknown function (DUF2934)
MRSTECCGFSFEERRLSGPKGIHSVPSRQTPAAINDQEQIRYRAYDLYVQNGYRDGYAMDDWLTAERQVRGQLLSEPCWVWALQRKTCDPHGPFWEPLGCPPMEYQVIRERISELLKEIETIRIANEKEKLTKNVAGRRSFESRSLRLEEIKHELRQLSTKMRSGSEQLPDNR